MVIFVIYISAFSSFTSSAVSPVISMIDASSIPFVVPIRIGGKTKCVKMNETLNQWKAL